MKSKINQHVESMGLFDDNLGDSWICFRKGYYHRVMFTYKPVSFFFHFKLHQYGKSMLGKIDGCERRKNPQGMYSNLLILFHLVALKRVKTCGAKGVVFLSVDFLKLNNVIHV